MHISNGCAEWFWFPKFLNTIQTLWINDNFTYALIFDNLYISLYLSRIGRGAANTFVEWFNFMINLFLEKNKCEFFTMVDSVYTKSMPWIFECTCII